MASFASTDRHRVRTQFGIRELHDERLVRSAGHRLQAVGEVEDVAPWIVAWWDRLYRRGGGSAFGDPLHDRVDDRVVDLGVAAGPRRTTAGSCETFEQGGMFLMVVDVPLDQVVVLRVEELAVADDLVVNADDRVLER